MLQGLPCLMGVRVETVMLRDGTQPRLLAGLALHVRGHFPRPRVVVQADGATEDEEESDFTDDLRGTPTADLEQQRN